MAAISSRFSIRPRISRKWWWVAAALAIPSLLAIIHFAFTARLDPISPDEYRPIERGAVIPTADAPLKWPVKPLEGRPAVQFLLKAMHAAEARLDAAGGYSATLRRRERVNGRLGDEQISEIKCRNRPFAIYMKFVTPEKGKEVVYAEGRYDNEVVAHGVGFSRRIIPRIKVAPTHPLAMSGNRHPITDAGIANLTKKLIRFRNLDLDDPLAENVVDRVKDASGREWYRSRHSHPTANGLRPFKYVEVLYDPANMIPRQILSYDWPAAGESGPLKLAEKYTYDDLNLEASLTELDFDPANPAYDFAGN